MEPSEDKQWAQKYILDPLTAPEPSEETGPGSHFYRTPSLAPASPSTTAKSQPTSTIYPTPPPSASPSRSSFHPSNPYSDNYSPPYSPNTKYRQQAFGSYNQQQAHHRSSSVRDSASNRPAPVQGLRRNQSLRERFPGDMSHRPLDQIRQESKVVNGPPRSRARFAMPTDIIDNLDRTSFGGSYHHGGPYDATLASRNMNVRYAPVEAVKETNSAALKATPNEYIQDSLKKHLPLQGTATVPTGMPGPDGSLMEYEEGADLMREEDAPGGPYKRWPGVKYLPEDYKGKGEPSFSLERAMKEKGQDPFADGNNGYEMQPRPRPPHNRSMSGNEYSPVPTLESTGVQRRNTTGRRMGEGLKRRFGSIRRALRTEN